MLSAVRFLLVPLLLVVAFMRAVYDLMPSASASRFLPLPLCLVLLLVVSFSLLSVVSFALNVCCCCFALSFWFALILSSMTRMLRACFEELYGCIALHCLSLITCRVRDPKL